MTWGSNPKYMTCEVIHVSWSTGSLWNLANPLLPYLSCPYGSMSSLDLSSPHVTLPGNLELQVTEFFLSSIWTSVFKSTMSRHQRVFKSQNMEAELPSLFPTIGRQVHGSSREMFSPPSLPFITMSSINKLGHAVPGFIYKEECVREKWVRWQDCSDQWCFNCIHMKPSGAFLKYNQIWHMYPNVHRSTIYNSQDMEAT